MSAESPSEYVEQLREQNKILRANVVQLVREKQVLQEQIARLIADNIVVKRRAGLLPHDYEPARPGIDVD